MKDSCGDASFRSRVKRFICRVKVGLHCVKSCKTKDICGYESFYLILIDLLIRNEMIDVCNDVSV